MITTHYTKKEKSTIITEKLQQYVFSRLYDKVFGKLIEQKYSDYKKE